MKKYLIAAGLIALSAGVASAQQAPTANADHKDGTHAQHGTATSGAKKGPHTTPTPAPEPTPSPTSAPTPAPSPSPAPTAPAPVGPTQ